jgi:hypothetical protein
VILQTHDTFIIGLPISHELQIQGKRTHFDISETHSSMQSKKNLEMLHFLLETFWKVGENCALSLP